MNKAILRQRRESKFGVFAAAAMAVMLVLILAGPAHDASAAGSNGGGLSLVAPSKKASGKSATKAGAATRFGVRVLRRGMSGPDVRVLKGIVRSKSLLRGAVSSSFDRPTSKAVRRFQRQASISASGVVNKGTARSLVGSMRTSIASWYGPGLFGNGTACGGTLKPGTMGVAHKTLPCGSKVVLGYRGRFVITKVIDRGPYAHGRTWDMTQAVQRALRFDIGVGTIRHAVIARK